MKNEVLYDENDDFPFAHNEIKKELLRMVNTIGQLEYRESMDTSIFEFRINDIEKRLKYCEDYIYKHI